jgi:hypothetical protein
MANLFKGETEMPETSDNIEFILELPVELRRSAELYMLERGIDFDTLLDRALTQFFALHE